MLNPDRDETIVPQLVIPMLEQTGTVSDSIGCRSKVRPSPRQSSLVKASQLTRRFSAWDSSQSAAVKTAIGKLALADN